MSCNLTDESMELSSVPEEDAVGPEFPVVSASRLSPRLRSQVLQSQITSLLLDGIRRKLTDVPGG